MNDLQQLEKQIIDQIKLNSNLTSINSEYTSKPVKGQSERRDTKKLIQNKNLRLRLRIFEQYCAGFSEVNFL